MIQLEAPVDPFESVPEPLAERGISRKAFVAFCASIAATLALPRSYEPAIAAALHKSKKPVIVWLEFQNCTGCTESFLRAAHPTVEEVLLDLFSVDYHDTIMAASGTHAERSLKEAIGNNKGQYIAVIEGSIPMKDGGIYCTVGGRTAIDIAREVCSGAAATVTVGACAFYGGWPSARPNPTGATGLSEALPGISPVVNLPGCSTNGANVVATLVHFLTFGELPATDQLGRPLFAYGQLIHDACERRGHFDAGEYVEVWGDEAHRKGWCLYKMGCKGPTTHHNCPIVKWNDGTSWPIGSSHGCIGCSEPNFWDADSPFYDRLPDVTGFNVQTKAQTIGVGLVAGTAAALGTHAVASVVMNRVKPLKHEDDYIPPGAEGEVEIITPPAPIDGDSGVKRP